MMSGYVSQYITSLAAALLCTVIHFLHIISKSLVSAPLLQSLVSEDRKDSNIAAAYNIAAGPLSYISTTWVFTHCSLSYTSWTLAKVQEKRLLLSTLCFVSIQLSHLIFTHDLCSSQSVNNLTPVNTINFSDHMSMAHYYIS